MAHCPVLTVREIIFQDDSRVFAPDFIQDMDRITREDNSPARIVADAKPLLAAVQHSNCMSQSSRSATPTGATCSTRRPDSCHRRRWGPGDNAKAHNHDTWDWLASSERNPETRGRPDDDGSTDCRSRNHCRFENGREWFPAWCRQTMVSGLTRFQSRHRGDSRLRKSLADVRAALRRRRRLTKPPAPSTTAAEPPLLRMRFVIAAYWIYFPVQIPFHVFPVP